MSFPNDLRRFVDGDPYLAGVVGSFRFKLAFYRLFNRLLGFPFRLLPHVSNHSTFRLGSRLRARAALAAVLIWLSSSDALSLTKPQHLPFIFAGSGAADLIDLGVVEIGCEADPPIGDAVEKETALLDRDCVLGSSGPSLNDRVHGVMSFERVIRVDNLPNLQMILSLKNFGDEGVNRAVARIHNVGINNFGVLDKVGCRLFTVLLLHKTALMQIVGGHIRIASERGLEQQST